MFETRKERFFRTFKWLFKRNRFLIYFSTSKWIGMSEGIKSESLFLFKETEDIYSICWCFEFHSMFLYK